MKGEQEAVDVAPQQKTAGFWAWTVLIWAIRSVTVVAYAWVAFMHTTSAPWVQREWSLGVRLFTGWMLLEVAYLPYWFITLQRLSAQCRPVAHACKSQAERIRILEKAVAATKITAMADGAQYYSAGEWFLRWFRPTSPLSPTFRVQDVKRGNLEEWIAWAGFDRSLQTVNEDSVLKADCAQLADHIEKILELKMQPGHNSEITSIRLTLDPIYATQRPLVYYFVIKLLHALGDIGVSLLGYRRRHVNGQTFLYRRATQAAVLQRTTPVVFCHGLGIGFLHYLRVLKGLPSSSDVYLLESHNITMTLGAETQRSVADTQALVGAMLCADGHGSACIVAHSFGTIIPSWLLNSRDAAVRALVKSVVLIDPISLLLFDPAVAFNFVHRRPTNATEIMMSYFVSQEMYIAHTLARRFSWSDAALFLDDIPSHVHVEVLLSGADAIVPAKLVRAYVEQHRAQAPHPNSLQFRKSPREGGGGGGGVQAPVWFDKVAHGELMLRERCVAAISRSCQMAVQSTASALSPDGSTLRRDASSQAL